MTVADPFPIIDSAWHLLSLIESDPDQLCNYADYMEIELNKKRGTRNFSSFRFYHTNSDKGPRTKHIAPDSEDGVCEWIDIEFEPNPSDCVRTWLDVNPDYRIESVKLYNAMNEDLMDLL